MRIACAMHHLEGDTDVIHFPGEDAELAGDGALADGDADPAVVRNPARGRLEGDDAAHGGGYTAAAAQVGPDAEGRAAGGDDRSLASARAAGRSVGIPRVVGAPVERVVGLDEEHDLRGIRLPQHDRAGLAELGDEPIVAGGPLARARGEPACRRQPREADALLDGDRNAVQRTHLLADGKAPIRALRFRAGIVEALGHQGVELGVHRLDPLDMGFDDFRGGELASRDSARELDGRKARKLALYAGPDLAEGDRIPFCHGSPLLLGSQRATG